MKFTHLVEINDAANPLIEPLTREQICRGLLLRAEDPLPFVVGLEQCKVVARTERAIQRELSFGNLVVRDTVTYVPMQSVRYDTAAQDEMPAASLVMRIEEPHPQALFVRFEYDSGTTPVEGDAMSQLYDDLRKQAYEEADIDTIRRIRELAQKGELGGPAN